jgi:hypothetical protein
LVRQRRVQMVGSESPPYAALTVAKWP